MAAQRLSIITSGQPVDRWMVGRQMINRISISTGRLFGSLLRGRSCDSDHYLINIRPAWRSFLLSGGSLPACRWLLGDNRQSPRHYRSGTIKATFAPVATVLWQNLVTCTGLRPRGSIIWFHISIFSWSWVIGGSWRSWVSLWIKWKGISAS